MTWKPICADLPKSGISCLKVCLFCSGLGQGGQLVTRLLFRCVLPRAEFCRNFDEETGRVEPGLDPTYSIVKDEAAMNILRLESRLTSATDSLGRLKAVMSRIDAAL